MCRRELNGVTKAFTKAVQKFCKSICGSIQQPYRSFAEALQKLYKETNINLAESLQKFCRSLLKPCKILAEASQKLYIFFTEACRSIAKALQKLKTKKFTETVFVLLKSTHPVRSSTTPPLNDFNDFN